MVGLHICAGKLVSCSRRIGYVIPRTVYFCNVDINIRNQSNHEVFYLVLKLYSLAQISSGDMIANRYHVERCLGSAAFSSAFAARDTTDGRHVCLKVIKSSKDFFDQSLDEIKLLKYTNAADPMDSSGILRLYDFLYYKEHLILVTELLQLNLYEWQRKLLDIHLPPYFSMKRIQSIAQQVGTGASNLVEIWSGHPENYLFPLSKKNFSGSKYPKNIYDLFVFENRSTGGYPPASAARAKLLKHIPNFQHQRA